MEDRTGKSQTSLISAILGFMILVPMLVVAVVLMTVALSIAEVDNLVRRFKKWRRLKKGQMDPESEVALFAPED